ncbi:MAG: hypothetical protein K2J06_07545, partial [Muribaculaceae bacterium]|nr:hypothetical protein [Muribaculaceae bacterium]
SAHFPFGASTAQPHIQTHHTKPYKPLPGDFGIEYTKMMAQKNWDRKVGGKSQSFTSFGGFHRIDA